MGKPSGLTALLILALLVQPLAARTPTPTAKNKKKKEYPPLALFRRKPKGAKPGLPGLAQETHNQPVTDWTDRYELNRFLSDNYGTKVKKPTEEEKVGAAAADIWGKVCLVLGALGVLGLTQKK
jgi:hypothetical protein